MRWIVLAAVVAASNLAAADKRIDDIATGYAKESAACRRDENGVGKVLEGARTLPDEAADTEKLDKGHAIVSAYCAELDAAIELLKTATNYKAIEGKLDESDNKIRRLRAASKKAVADLEPVLHRLIPKINAARVGPQVVTDHRTPAKFPSGRAVELPQLPGEWKLSGTAATDLAEYSEKAIIASVSVQPFREATCDQERRRLAGTVTEIEVPPVAKQLGVVWMASYTKSAHVYEVTCATASPGGVVAFVDITPEDQPKLVEELGKLGLRMIQAQLAPK